MRRYRRGVTLTELLTVVSLITILATMVQPILVSARAKAIQSACAHNMTEMYKAIQLFANNNKGKFPQCFETTGTDPDKTVIEDSWWYYRVAATAYPRLPGATAGAGQNDDVNPLSMKTNLFKTHQCILRCPASPDPHDQSHAPNTIPSVTNYLYSDKDRVYDNNYGYNNFGFAYKSSLSVLPNPNGIKPDNPGVNPLYHGSGNITGTYNVTDAAWNRTYTRIGGVADIRYQTSTILMMDYIKADVAPWSAVGDGRIPSNTYWDSDATNFGNWGYRFRHGSSTAYLLSTQPVGRANVLFLSGNVQSYTPKGFLLNLGKPGKLHWQVYR